MSSSPKKYDPVNHPKHYSSHPSGIEPIQILRHMGYNLGNVIKYAWRANSKGNLIEDLEKAAWYLNDEIEMHKTRKAELQQMVEDSKKPIIPQNIED